MSKMGPYRRRARLAAAGLGTAVAASLAAGAPGTEADPSHAVETEAWHRARIERLRKPGGWLSLVGLHWLSPGENPAGGGDVFAVALPPERVTGATGVFHVDGSLVRFEAAPRAPVVLADGETPVTTIDLATDQDGDPTILALGSLRFYAIERVGGLAVRVKDLESPLLAAFEGIERFPVTDAWRLTARYVPHEAPVPIDVPDITGHVNETPSPGIVTFALDGTTHALDVLSASDEGFFVVFGDETNGATTYGGGRFLVTGLPDESGDLVLDFNRAYNPPCVFTPYATCPLPPEGNRLALAIEAGEKAFGDDAAHGADHAEKDAK